MGLKEPISTMVNQNLVIQDLWNLDKSLYEQLIRDIFYNYYVESILKIYIPCSSKEGKKIWPSSKGGELFPTFPLRLPLSQSVLFFSIGNALQCNLGMQITT